VRVSRLVTELRKPFGGQDLVELRARIRIESVERFTASDRSPNEPIGRREITALGHVVPRGADVSLGGDNVNIRPESSSRSS
jgi:hypothetical protein